MIENEKASVTIENTKQSAKRVIENKNTLHKDKNFIDAKHLEINTSENIIKIQKRTITNSQERCIRWQNTIFDNVFRTMLEKMPELVVPLINEVFGTNYPADIAVEQQRNEHQTKNGERLQIPG